MTQEQEKSKRVKPPRIMNTYIPDIGGTVSIYTGCQLLKNKNLALKFNGKEPHPDNVRCPDFGYVVYDDGAFYVVTSKRFRKKARLTSQLVRHNGLRIVGTRFPNEELEKELKKSGRQL